MPEAETSIADKFKEIRAMFPAQDGAGAPPQPPKPPVKKTWQQAAGLVEVQKYKSDLDLHVRFILTDGVVVNFTSKDIMIVSRVKHKLFVALQRPIAMPSPAKWDRELEKLLDQATEVTPEEFENVSTDDEVLRDHLQLFLASGVKPIYYHNREGLLLELRSRYDNREVRALHVNTGEVIMTQRAFATYLHEYYGVDPSSCASIAYRAIRAAGFAPIRRADGVNTGAYSASVVDLERNGIAIPKTDFTGTSEDASLIT